MACGPKPVASSGGLASGAVAWVARAAFVVVFAIAAYGAWDPRHNHEASVPPADAVEHIGYGYILTLLTVASLPKVSPWLIGGIFLAGGAGFELTQVAGLVAGTAQWGDLAANLAGVAAALAPFALGRLRPGP